MASIKERVALLQAAANNPELQAALYEKCRRDPNYFINNFCWTFDPRVIGGRVPFNLYPFQEDEVIPAIRNAIDNKEDLLIDKSRDMGVSWLILAIFLWYWLFDSPANFLCGSRKEDYVDTLGDISTLFPKIRFMLRWLPPWLLPKGYDSKKHDSHLKIINPENENTITGESTNPDFARGGRYKAVLFDEFPKWAYDEAAYGSAYQSTPSRLLVGTPYGKGNKFARIRFHKDGSNVRTLSIHWRKHPLKDDAWYAKECARASKNEIARELDISYEMSTEGVVFPEFNPQTHIVKGFYVFQPDRKNIAAFDFGFLANASLVAQLDENGTLHVGKEIILKNTNTELLSQEFITFASFTDTSNQWTYTCDPSGKAQKGANKEESTHHQVLEKAGIAPLQYDKAQAMRNRLEDGIQMIKTALSTRGPGGVEKILIYEDGCPTLIEAFQSEYRYVIDANGNITETIHEEHPWEDVMDCLRYIIIQCFSIQPVRRAPRASSPTRNRNSYTGYRR